MKVKADFPPSAAFTVEPEPKKPGFVCVRFYENVEAFLENKDGLTISGYKYDEYRLTLPDTPVVSNDVAEKYHYFIAEAKRQDPEAIDEVMELKLALAEMAQAQEEMKTTHELAMAELAAETRGG